MANPVTIWSMLYFLALGFLIMLLLADSRFSFRRTAAVVGTAFVVLAGAELLIYALWGLQTLIWLYTPLIHIPFLLAFLLISRSKNWQMVFQLLSTILFLFVVHQGASLCYVLSGGQPWAMYVGYGVLSSAVVLFLVKYLRPLAWRIFDQIHQGWWLMCLLLVGYYAINIYLIPDLAGASVLATYLKAAITLLMVGVYAVFLYLLNSLYREMEVQHEATVSALRLSGLQRRLAALREAEETIRVERHDLRHRLLAVRELVRQGRDGEALDFLDDARERLDETRPVHWCRPPVLDAVFSSYFDQAQRQEIQVEAEIALPDPLPVDEGELAIVFANALENAIHACMALQAAERRIRCKVISQPGIMFEIANPCSAPVRLDDRGLPVSGREGHGLGSQSIAAFCRKYNAMYRYETSDGWFLLRVVL